MTIKLEVGRRYVRRGGDITAPLTTSRRHHEWPFLDPETGLTYRPDGTQAFDWGVEKKTDLIALAPDEAPQPSEGDGVRNMPHSSEIDALFEELSDADAECNTLARRGYLHNDGQVVAAKERYAQARAALFARLSQPDELATLRERVRELDDQLAQAAAAIVHSHTQSNTLRAENARLREALIWAKPYVARLRDTEIIDAALAQTEAENG